MKPLLLLLALAATPIFAADRDALETEAEQALRRGIEFFREQVASQGTYLWQYSEDLSKREGEGKATITQGWVQPPGTPAVGMAFLEAWKAAGEQDYLDAARETAHGLLRGQLQSGGWAHSLELDPKLRKKHAYRDRPAGSGRNVTTFDDDSTQAAIRFLVRTDAALDFKDAKIHEAIAFALNAILQAQYPAGAWPQGYDRFPEPGKFPVLSASYPESWPREWPGSQQYWLRYTLNDNALATLIDTLLEVEKTYRHASAPTAALGARCREAALKAGDFLLRARMPEPQPIWAQQYDFEMHPSWARKFEPPSVTAGESQNVLRILLQLYAETGEEKYLQPLPRALEYLRSIRLPDGQFARFYELKTSRPLYFTRDYRLTYDDSDVPTHYGFKVSDRTESIEREYREALADRKSFLEKEEKPPGPDEIQAILRTQDAQGRWVEERPLRYHGPNDDTRRVIRSATFVRNIEALSRFLAAAKK